MSGPRLKGDDVSEIPREFLNRQEQAPKPREISPFQPRSAVKPPEVTFTERLSNAVQSVKDFFSFSDSLKGEVKKTQ
jgi:hypothetical protein